MIFVPLHFDHVVKQGSSQIMGPFFLPYFPKTNLPIPDAKYPSDIRHSPYLTMYRNHGPSQGKTSIRQTLPSSAGWFLSRYLHGK